VSHVEEVAIDCQDLQALSVAAALCGGELVLGQTTHAWWGTWVGDWRDQNRSAVAQGRDPKTFGKCMHAIRIKGKPGKNGSAGPWEIGVVRSADGEGYSLLYDNYGYAGNELERLFGRACSKLKSELAAEIAMRELIRDGWRVQRTQTSSGEIVLDVNE
jgi:hypothetical protein